MITINVVKGLVRVDDWSDIERRVGFRTDIDPTKHTLASIIGRYVVDKVRCGLSNCHKQHARGYIVTTEDGFETNIGKDCGRTYFGVDFEEKSKQFDRDIEEKERRETLWSFSFRVDEIAERIADIRNGAHGADWIYKRSRPLITMGQSCPATIVRYVSNMLKSGSDAVNISREATEAEVDREEGMLGHTLQRPHYVFETIGTISGLQALADENDLRKILVLDLVENLATFRTKSINELSFEELRYWSKWTSSVDESCDKAERSVALGQNLLIPSNLMCLRKILKTQEEKSAFAAYLQTLK